MFRASSSLSGLFNPTFSLVGLILLLALPLPSMADTTEDAIQKAYIAYYARPADPAGLNFWASRLNENQGNLHSLINQFGTSPEYTERFSGLANATLVDNIYQNLFNRTADAAGRDFYIDRLATGQSTLASISLNILDGATNTDNTIIANKLNIATYYTQSLANQNDIYDLSFAVNLLSTVTELPATVNDARQQIDRALSPTTVGCISNGTESLPIGVNQFHIEQTIDNTLVSRRFLLHSPLELEANKCYPLLFSLHGSGGNPDFYPSVFRNWVEAGEFIGVYPAGHLNSWNLGREASTADDVAFLEAVADALQTYGNIDHSRRYIVGYSNGAGMAHTLGGESDYFNAFAAIVTSLTTTNLPTNNNRHPAVLQILGIEDPLIPYTGGNGVLGHTFLSAEQSALTWAEHNQCDLTPIISTLADGSTRTAYTGCINNREVVNYGVIGAGHNIPDDFAGGLYQLVWEFLSKH